MGYTQAILEKLEENRKKTIKDGEKSLKKRKDTLKDTTEKKVNAVEFFNNLTDTEKKQFQMEIARKKARENYGEYLKYVYGDTYIITRFHSFLIKLCQSVVEKVENGQMVRLCISVPPQKGKSRTITSTLPSWFLMRNPDRESMITGYNADIALEFSNNNRQLIKQYGKELFNVEVSDSQDSKDRFLIKNHVGGMRGAGILGGLTGFGGSLVIVDDPYKNGEEADSQDNREKISSTFRDSVLTRVRGVGNACIVIHTRWRDDDLIGELEKTGDWIVINIPEVWESGIDRYLNRKIGEPLCPELGFTVEWCEMQKKSLGMKKWMALHQGKPYIESGNLIQKSDIKYYTKTTRPLSFEELTLSCDLSFGGKREDNDPCCMTLWGRNGADHYLLKIINRKMNYPDVIREIRTLSSLYPQMRKKIVERKANGQAVIDTLNSEIGGIVAYSPKESKEARLQLVLPYFEAGNVFFPNQEIEPKIEEFEQQLLRFPKTTHDDFVDTITQYLLNYEYRYGGKIDTDNRYSQFAKIIRGF